MLEQLSVDDLKQRLQEKENTVVTLTEYLEQAAAKLNNLQKQTSGGKPARAFDAEEVQRQVELVKHLQAAVEEWEELKAPATLERISSQLDGLRETLLESVSSPNAAPPLEHSGVLQSGLLASLNLSNPDGESPKQPGNALEGWEALKAEMLKDEGNPVPEEEEGGRIDLKEELEVLVNRPEHVDPTCDKIEIWQEAVDSREKYMISLIRALRVVENRRRGTPDWESFTDVPAELRAEVVQLSTELQQTLRNAEVEQSIERARISRQESVIAQQRREIEKDKKKHSNSNKPSSPNGSAPADSQQGRWLKFLGRNAEE